MFQKEQLSRKAMPDAQIEAERTSRPQVEEIPTGFSLRTLSLSIQRKTDLSDEANIWPDSIIQKWETLWTYMEYGTLT